MNQFNSNQVPQVPQQPQQPQQPMPQQQMPAQPPQQQPAGGQFEMPPTQVPQQQSYQGAEMEPQQGGGSKTWILIIVLVIILVLGGLVFASWAGWISLGPIDKLLGKTDTVTTTSTTETTVNNDATRKADLVKIKDALKSYYQANQSYPVAQTMDKTNDPNSVLKVLVPTYLASLPTDPVATKYYGYTSDGKTFALTAVLDDTTDPTGVKVGNYYLYKVTDVSTETPTATSGTGTTTTDTTTTDTTTETTE